VGGSFISVPGKRNFFAFLHIALVIEKSSLSLSTNIVPNVLKLSDCRFTGGRPIGPSGAEEHGTEWRCRTFVWASDVYKSPS
jgi:hypothetical protein